MTAVKAFGKSSTELIQREAARLAALDQLDLLDTPRDDGFERVVRLIKDIFTVDIALVSLIDAHRQWYKACAGLGQDEVARQDSFCRYVVDADQPVIVQDATRDDRFSSHPAVTGSTHIRFYAGVPLKTRDGHTIGTVCAIDRETRSFSHRDVTILEELAGAAMDRIELLQSVSTDSLTDALTRRAFRHEAEQLISASLRHQHSLSCIVFDIDKFKLVNDTFGHATGDEVLKAVTATCRAALRAEDLFGRLGGEEFAILLPGVSERDAWEIGERIRTQVELVPANPAQLSVSIGIACMTPLVTMEWTGLVEAADKALYAAKAAGRNRCHVAENADNSLAA